MEIICYVCQENRKIGKVRLKSKRPIDAETDAALLKKYQILISEVPREALETALVHHYACKRCGTEWDVLFMEGLE